MPVVFYGACSPFVPFSSLLSLSPFEPLNSVAVSSFSLRSQSACLSLSLCICLFLYVRLNDSTAVWEDPKI